MGTLARGAGVETWPASGYRRAGQIRAEGQGEEADLLRPASLAGTRSPGVALDRRAKARAAALALGILIALVAFPMVANGAAKRRCVLPRGRTQLSNRLIRAVLVTDDNAQSLNLFACAYARNRVRRVASISTGSDAPPTLRVRRYAGTWLAIEGRFSSQYEGYGFTRIADAASGRRFVIYGYHVYSQMIPPPRPLDTPPISLSAYFLTSDGRVVAAFTDYGDQTKSRATQVRIVAFSSRGVQRQLDAAAPPSISPSSLRLRGRTASWTHDGQVRAAQL